MKPLTYLRIHLLADVLRIMECGLQVQQSADTLSHSATDVAAQVENLKSQLCGYGLSQPTPAQAETVKSDNNEDCIINRVIKECKLDSPKWQIQAGLKRLGFRNNRSCTSLRLHLQAHDDDRHNRQRIPFPCDKADFKNAVEWIRIFLRNLILSIDKRFEEESVWRVLAPLLGPEAWRIEQFPVGLDSIATFFSETIGRVQEEWMYLRPIVAGILGPKPPLADVEKDHFRSNVLLPGLSGVPVARQGFLWKALATAAMTIGNCAQLERDMKSIREIWRKRTKKLSSDTMGKQIRLSLNYKERPEEYGCKSTTAAAWSKWNNSKKLHRAFAKRKERCDKGREHKRPRRSAPTHLKINEVQEEETHKEFGYNSDPSRSS